MTEPNLFNGQYLIYTRKSTDDTDNQKNSIAYQKMEAIRFAKVKNLAIADFNLDGFCTAGAVTERHTGFKEDQNFLIQSDGFIKYKVERPKFYQLISFLKQRKFKGVIFLCWDRASRNKTDDNILCKLMDQGVDIHFVQATYDKTSSGELHKDIDGMFSQHYSRVIKEKVTNTTRKLRNEGICTYRAPIGYLNLGDPKNKPLDPKRAPVVKQLFKKYATGKFTLHELARWANSQNLTMNPQRRKRTVTELLADEETILMAVSRPVTYNNIHKILTNRFYTGFIMGNSKNWVKSISHKPLVSIELFEKVQQLRGFKRTSTSYDIHLSHPYRGIFRCQHCKRVFTPYEQKNRLYYGAKCAENCSNTQRNFSRAYLEYLVAEKISQMVLNSVQKTQVLRNADDLSRIEQQIQLSNEERLRKKNKAVEDLGYIRSNKLSLLRTGSYTPEELIKEENQLLSQITDLSKVEVFNPKVFAKDVVVLSELAKTLHFRYLLGNPAQKERIISSVFSELNLAEKTLVYKAKNGFAVFDNTDFAFCDPTTWFSEHIKYHNLVKISIEKISLLI